MGKEKGTDKEERKKDKKEKKEKRSEKDGVHKSKKDKKEKKVVATAPDSNITTTLLENIENTESKTVALKENGSDDVKVKTAPLLGALVPFANPLADEKACKKVLKSVKKGTIPQYAAYNPPIADQSPFHTSGQEQNPQTWRQRSRQIPPQIRPSHKHHCLSTARHRHPSR